MRGEISTAAQYLAALVRAQGSDSAAGAFERELAVALETRFAGHWHADAPERGSAFRCLRSAPGKPDPVLAGLQCQDAVARLPAEFCLWIDPAEVAVRLGSRGHITSLAPSPASSPRAP